MSAPVTIGAHTVTADTLSLSSFMPVGDLGLLAINAFVIHAAEPVLVDTGAELSWIPADALEALGIERYAQLRFRQASGSIVERWVGPAFIYAAGKRTTDDVVFGEPGDLVLLGARSLEGLNVRVEPATRQLVDAGPVPAAMGVSI